MTTKSRRSSRPTRRRREKTTWENVNFEALFSAVASSIVVDLTPQFLASNGYQQPCKIVRSIIDIDYNTLNSNLNPQTMAMGIWVVEHEALTGDGTASPLTDFQQDFYYWTTLYINDASVVRESATIHVDIRSSRRIRGGYGLLLKGENPLQEEATVLQVSMRNLWVLS